MAVSDKLKEFAEKWASEYEKVKPSYEKLAREIHHFLFKVLDAETQRNPSFKLLLVTGREKKPEKFKIKATRSTMNDPDVPFYKNPLSNDKHGIPDMAGVRVIVYCLDDLPVVKKIIADNFEVIDVIDKYEQLRKTGRFGYQAIHFLVKLRESTAISNPETELIGKMAEIQVKTILGHAWAEIEHRTYDNRIHKLGDEASKEKIRRFQAIAGLLEIADREFNQLKI